jgi:hypothetical protein
MNQRRRRHLIEVHRDVFATGGGRMKKATVVYLFLLLSGTALATGGGGKPITPQYTFMGMLLCRLRSQMARRAAEMLV